MASLTPTEEAFLTMCRMAGIDSLKISERHGPTTLSFPGIEITVEEAGVDQIIIITNCWLDSRSFLNDNEISRIISTFSDGVPFYFGERFPLLTALWILQNDPSRFPIVAQSFDALSIERPGLRPQYDRVKAAWEATQ